LLDYEALQKTKIFGEQTAAARNEVIAKKIASGLLQNLSGRPEDWTVSGPCHLYCTPLCETWAMLTTADVFVKKFFNIHLSSSKK